MLCPHNLLNYNEQMRPMIEKKYKTSAILNFPTKKELESVNLKCMYLENKYTYYPLYDTKNNSYIRRYRLWVKYRDDCKSKNIEPLNVKDFGKFINKVNSTFIDYLISDPSGILLGKFKMKLQINKEQYKKRRGKVYITIFGNTNAPHLFKPSAYYIPLSWKNMLKIKNISFFEFFGEGFRSKTKIDYNNMFNDL